MFLHGTSVMSSEGTFVQILGSVARDVNSFFFFFLVCFGKKGDSKS